MATTRPSPTPIPSPEAIRAALIELLLPDPYSEAATPTTLAAIICTRREFTESCTDPSTNPLSPLAPASLRHAGLTQALGTIGLALLNAHHHRPHTDCLHAGLADLAAIALAWLDALDHTPEPDDGEDDGDAHDNTYHRDSYEDESPF